MIFVVIRDLLQPTAQSRRGHATPHTKFPTLPRLDNPLITVEHLAAQKVTVIARRLRGVRWLLHSGYRVCFNVWDRGARIETLKGEADNKTRYFFQLPSPVKRAQHCGFGTGVAH